MEPGTKPVPVIVTFVPPSVEPVEGETAVIIGETIVEVSLKLSTTLVIVIKDVS